MFSEKVLCTAVDNSHVRNILAPSGLAAPASTPAYSTWRMAVVGSEAVVVAEPSAVTVAAGEEE